jgi:hypothetical protein
MSVQTTQADERELVEHVEEARLTLRRYRRARRRAFWSGLGDVLLSIPPGIAARLGG